MCELRKFAIDEVRKVRNGIFVLKYKEQNLENSKSNKCIDEIKEVFTFLKDEKNYVFDWQLISIIAVIDQYKQEKISLFDVLSVLNALCSCNK